jgi:pentatricopeptide repeat protein
VTKRLYGVSASDIIFFDDAIDRFNKRRTSALSDASSQSSIHSSVSNSNGAGIGNTVIPNMESSVRRLVNRVTGHSDLMSESDEPLLQSARVHRKLKTIVPPEPSAEGLNDAENDIGIGFTYSTFPTKFDKDLFCMPRPLPPAVLAEFDRQQDDAAQFRRRLKSNLRKRDVADLSQEKKSPEATTFTVFLVAFTALIGKELVELSNNLHECEDERHILATYTADTADGDSQVTPLNEEMKVSHDEDSFTVEKRFKGTISSAKVEEAKARASAQLNLAFEILDIMKEREIKTDPVAYKCLIDACGRCGDTERATHLLTRMHDDGIVADGVVYSCLVSAFSVENTYGNLVNRPSDLPKWANGASVELNWNNLQKKPLGISRKQIDEEDPLTAGNSTRANTFRQRISKYIENRLNKDEEVKEKKVNAAEILGDAPTKDRFVTETVANQIGFGENLLEIVYPGKCLILIEMR